MGLEDKFVNADSVVLLAALVWWIVCLWIDEPGSKAAADPAETAPPVAGQLPHAAESKSAS
jgi:hypothetical protein